MPDITAPSPELAQFVGAQTVDPPGAPPTAATGALGAPSDALQGFVQNEVNEEKYGTPLEQAKTVAEGVGRGATLGLSDAAETKLFGVKPEDIKGRQNANPIESNLAQIGGGAALIAGTGGLAAPIEGALGAGTAARVIGYGLEGAAFGAGNAVSDAALGDPDLNAQKVLADIGMGAAFGSGFGALSKGVEAILPKASQKLSQGLSNLREAAIGTEENPGLLVKAMSVPGSAMEGSSQESWINDLFEGLSKGKDGIDRKAFSNNLSDIYDAGENAQQELLDTMGNARKSPSSKASFTKGPFKNFPAKPGASVLEATSETIPELASAESQAAQEFSELRTIKKDFQSAFMQKVGKDDYELDPAKMKSFFENFNSPKADTQKEILESFLSKSQGLSETTKNYFGYKAGQDSIGSKISQLAKEHGELSEVAQALKGGKSEGPFDGLMGDVLKGSFLHQLGVSNPVVGAALTGLEAYKAIKNPYELGANLSNTISKLQAIGDITEKITTKVGTLSRGVFSQSAERSAPQLALNLASNDTYDKRVERIDELAGDPQGLTNHISHSTDGIYEAAPHISQGLGTAMASAVGFLSSKVPRPPTQTLLSEKFEPSNAEKQKFQTYYKAVDDPLSVLKDVKNGTLTNETMEALQAVHPHLLQEMRKTVLENFDAKKAMKLDYGVKLSLASFLGQPLDPNMAPMAIAQNQIALNAPTRSQQNAPSDRKIKARAVGLRDLKAASRAATQTQELEEPEG